MQTHRSALITLISVFFFWGFVAASNDILIPVFKEKLNLEQWQSQMISFAFYIAYTIGSIIYLGVSKLNGGDILNRLGYKNGIALGLVISAGGTLLFYPAAQLASFPLMISGLFVVAFGFSLQQTAANPLAIVMGDSSKGAQRLSLAGGINNIGTTIGPLVVSFAIFGSVTQSHPLQDLSSVKIPYLILGAAFIIVAIIFKLSNLPNHIQPTEHNLDKTEKGSVLKFPQLWMGMIAIFLYVGVEVSTAANLSDYMKQHLAIPTEKAAPYISLFWASLMIGRWASSADVFSMNKLLKITLRIIIPYLAFAVFLLANAIAGHDLNPFYPYSLVIIILIVADFLSKGNPSRQLLLYAVLGISALIIGMLTNGLMSVYAFISVGLFCSTLWPCIFTLAIAGLGHKTNQGASYLIMMIMGGGFMSLLQGWLADPERLGIKASYSVGVFCFLYLAFYGYQSAQLLKKQGIDLNQSGASVH